MDDDSAAQPNYGAIDPDDLLVARRVREIVQAGTLNQEELAKELGLSQPQISRLLQGKTSWRKVYLKRLARLYNTPLSAMLFDIEEVPIVSRIIDDQGFSYSAIEDRTQWLGKAYAPLGEPTAAGLYCLHIQGEGFKPFFGSWGLIYIRRDCPNIQEDNLVIHVDEEDRGHLRQVKFANDDLILKSLAPSGPYFIRPKTHLRALDKVEWIKI